MLAVLNGATDGFVHWMGIVCSTWVVCSRGSTGRCLLNPHGCDDIECVFAANLMVCRQLYPTLHMQFKSNLAESCSFGCGTTMPCCRCCLLCLATVAFGGTWVIEQPGSSILFHHERCQQLCGMMKAGEVRLLRYYI